MDYFIGGYIPDKPDIRDFNYESAINLKASPNAIDLRDDCMPKVYNQGQVGSCTAQAATASYEYQCNRVTKNLLNLRDSSLNSISNKLSRMFIYYMVRYMESDPNVDSGATLRGICKASTKYGIAVEADFSESSSYSTKPSFDSLARAGENKFNAYYRVNTLEGILDALSRHIPVIIGTDVTQFMDAGNNGGLSKQVLTWNTKFAAPNHAMLIVGFIPGFNYLGQTLDVFIIRNSWGDTWGDKGYCYVPVNQLLNYNTFDMWVTVKDTLYSDNENSDYKDRINRIIPVNTVVIGNKAYDLAYANSPEHADEINAAIVGEDSTIFIRNTLGQWSDINGSVTNEPGITFPIYYKDSSGNSTMFE